MFTYRLVLLTLIGTDLTLGNYNYKQLDSAISTLNWKDFTIQSDIRTNAEVQTMKRWSRYITIDIEYYRGRQYPLFKIKPLNFHRFRRPIK
jgi:hypothetical protein